ncbi:hypothetical protein AXF42_Ash016148 [Apostasia shenzhenica]|uniref:LysM domain-containing protein n=1 Tax=Apostasia shenzhenica TaxID=1088818 RepID=A0A2I0AEM4_9ASPA|nr:hypothetical protein AXF42_Ash016148 [Apostasia shenzhenica]
MWKSGTHINALHDYREDMLHLDPCTIIQTVHVAAYVESASQVLHSEEQTPKSWRRKARTRTDLCLTAIKDHPAFKRHGLSRRRTVLFVHRTTTAREWPSAYVESASQVLHPEEQTPKSWRRKARTRIDLCLIAIKDHPAFKRHRLFRRQTVPSVHPDVAAWCLALGTVALVVMSTLPESSPGEALSVVRGEKLAGQRRCEEIYVVGEGETLHTISDKCGDPFIVERNPHVHDPDDVFPGLVLKLAPLSTRAIAEEKEQTVELSQTKVAIFCLLADGNLNTSSRSKAAVRVMPMGEGELIRGWWWFSTPVLWSKVAALWVQKRNMAARMR